MGQPSDEPPSWSSGPAYHKALVAHDHPHQQSIPVLSWQPVSVDSDAVLVVGSITFIGDSVSTLCA